MSEVLLPITSCIQCPHFKKSDSYSSDGWDRMEDWFCTKNEDKQIIQGAVEWHEIKSIKIPEWCPLPTDKFKKAMLDELKGVVLQNVNLVSSTYVYKDKFVFTRLTKDMLWYVTYSNKIIAHGQYRHDIEQWIDIAYDLK